MNKASGATLELLEHLESPGGRPNLIAYRDIGGVWTNGFGNTHGVDANTPPITPERARADLERNADDVAAGVDALVTVPLNDNQRGALIIFAFNEGIGALRGSTLLRLLNEGNYEGAAQQFDKWDKYHDANGVLQTSAGLQARRATEKGLFLTPVRSDVPAPQLASSTHDSGKAAPPPAPTSVMQTSTGKAQASALLTGGAAALIEGAKQAQPLADAVHSAVNMTAGLPQIMQLLVGVFIFSSMGFVAWTLYDKHRKVKSGEG